MTGVRPNILVTLAHLSDLTPKPNEYDLMSLNKDTGGLWKDKNYSLYISFVCEFADFRNAMLAT